MKTFTLLVITASVFGSGASRRAKPENHQVHPGENMQFIINDPNLGVDKINPVRDSENREKSKKESISNGVKEQDIHPNSVEKEYDTIETISFYLKDRKLVTGRLISEDRNKITVEQLKEGRLGSHIYPRYKINSQTISTKELPDFQYYRELGEFFSSSAGDFKHDLSDFNQAIRFYERAENSLIEVYGKDSKKAKSVKKRIEQLKHEKETWEKEIKFVNRFQNTIKEREPDKEKEAGRANKKLSETRKRLGVCYRNLQQATHYSKVLRERINQLRLRRRRRFGLHQIYYPSFTRRTRYIYMPSVYYRSGSGYPKPKSRNKRPKQKKQFKPNKNWLGGGLRLEVKALPNLDD